MTGLELLLITTLALTPVGIAFSGRLRRSSRGRAACCGDWARHSVRCDLHRYEWCPDQIVTSWQLSAHRRFFGIVIAPDGGGGAVEIRFCPWCAERLR